MMPSGDKVNGITTVVSNPSLVGDQHRSTSIGGSNLSGGGPRNNTKENEVAKVWREILDDGNNFRVDDFALPKRQEEPSITSSEMQWPEPASKVDNFSLYSILPAGITLSTDLREASSFRKRNTKSGCKRLLIACCTTDPYNTTKKKLAYASFRIEDYYNEIVKELELLETELHLEIPAAFQEELNIIGAQIWFVTLALGRLFSEQKLETSDHKKFQTLYQNLVEMSAWLLKKNKILEATLAKFTEIETKCIHSMKKTYSGSSETDLSKEQISEVRTSEPERPSLTELALRAMVNRKVWENKLFSITKRKSPSQEYMLFGPDNLAERRTMDIFMRNVTKAGWVNFEVHFIGKNKIELLQEVLNQGVQGVKNVKKFLPKILRKFKRGARGCTCGTTCIPWVQRMANYIDIIVSNNKYNPGDNETVRLQIFAVEIFLKNMITRGDVIRKEIQNIINTVVLCCDYLEKVYFFHISKPTRLTQLKNILNKAEEKFEDSSFFLNDYVLVLKQVPIRYGMTEYILINKITVSRQHSGVNFDGPRFLKVGM